jgi:hypothetical protein
MPPRLAYTTGPPAGIHPGPNQAFGPLLGKYLHLDNNSSLDFGLGCPSISPRRLFCPHSAGSRIVLPHVIRQERSDEPEAGAQANTRRPFGEIRTLPGHIRRKSAVAIHAALDAEWTWPIRAPYARRGGSRVCQDPEAVRGESTSPGAESPRPAGLSAEIGSSSGAGRHRRGDQRANRSR